MSDKLENSAVSRRSFLRALTVTAVAATATGAGAALVNQSINNNIPATTFTTQTLNTHTPPPSDWLAELAALKAENARLQTELAAAQRNLQALQASTNQSATQTDTLMAQLDEANQQIVVLSGLLALYEQLDDLDVTGLALAGLTAVSDALTALLAQIPSLEEGITQAQATLNELDEQLPLLENGRLWLQRQTEKLETYFADVTHMLETAVEKAAPFLELLNQWFADILKWLPFGLGQRAQQVMTAMTTLFTELPPTIQGLGTNVAEPLDMWLAEQQGEPALRHKLIRPLQETIFTNTSATLTQIQQVSETYRKTLAEPVETAVHQQQTIRQLIAAYRQQNGL